MNDRTNGAPHEETARRPKTRAEERIEALGNAQAHAAPPEARQSAGGPAGLPEQLDELRARAERAEQEAADNKAAWQRSAADFSNYRRRTEQQREEELGLANEMLLLKVLSVADDFDRAIAHVPPDQQGSPWVEGISAIDRKLHALLDSEGVRESEPAEGQPFDPRQQEAIAYEETTAVPDGTVLRELQRGYRIRDRVLRPSLVSVGKNSGTQSNTSTTTDSGAAPDGRE
jgi:molecular chaperone GrpE